MFSCLFWVFFPIVAFFGDLSSPVFEIFFHLSLFTAHAQLLKWSPNQHMTENEDMAENCFVMQCDHFLVLRCDHLFDVMAEAVL